MSSSFAAARDELRTRFTWAGYGFLLGLIVGVVFGWQFNWLFNTIIFLFPLLIILVVVVGGYIGWRRFTDRRAIREEVEAEERLARQADAAAIETRSRVVESEVERRA